MRSVRLKKPFVGGMITDVPAHEIGITNSPFAQDGFSPSGVFRQRNAWAYDGTTADVADNLVTVMRNNFAIADTTRTVTCDDDGDIFIHNPAGAGTALFTGSVSFLARCVYRDEVMFCAQDGVTPMRRYAGAGSTGTASDLVGTFTINTASITALSFSAQPDVGAFLFSSTGADFQNHHKILSTTSTSVTLEDHICGETAAGYTFTISLTGIVYPCVGFYSTGSQSVSAGTATGVGTLWVDQAGVVAQQDCFLVQASSGLSHINSPIITVTNNTSMDVSTTSESGAYQLTRSCPFKDVASHKESLWGTGVAQYPNRVYVSPPGWNPSFPPGATLPQRIIPVTGDVTGFQSENPNDYLLGFIDVPTPYDGDHNVAILTSPNPLLVLKRKAVYGIFGSFGGLSVDLIADGIGCLDIRSAFSYDEAQFWAGEQGIFMYQNGGITDLTSGKINREWRALTRDFDFGTSDYCTLGLASGHLVVHITTGGGNTQRTYLCDLRDGSWQSRITNFTPRYMFTSRIPGEKEKLLAVSNDRQGRVLDFAPALDGSGTADDDAGSAPRFKAWTPKVGADGVDGITRLVDVAIHANVYDAGAAGSTSMEAAVVSEGGIGNPASSTKTLTAIESDTTDNLNRHHRRIARDGRLHQVQLEVDAVGTDTNATKVEVNQIDFNLRDNRGRAR